MMWLLLLLVLIWCVVCVLIVVAFAMVGAVNEFTQDPSHNLKTWRRPGELGARREDKSQ